MHAFAIGRQWVYRHNAKLGICVSVAVHAALLGALVRYSMPYIPGRARPTAEGPLELDVTWVEESSGDEGGVTRTALLTADAQKEVAAEPPAMKELRAFYGDDLPAPAGTMGDFVRQSIEAAAELAAAKPEEDLLEHLDQLGTRLGGISSEDRMARLSHQLGRWLDTTQRATEPACEPATGTFDIETAQIHDVVRESDADGRFIYAAVLIDAAGRSQHVPLERSEGERLYKIMSLIKKHPLLEALYRDVVMAFLDKLAGHPPVL